MFYILRVCLVTKYYQTLPALTIGYTRWNRQYHCNVMTGHSYPHYWSFVKGNQLSAVDSTHKEPVMMAFDVCCVVDLKRPLNKQSGCGWFGTLWRSWYVTFMVLASSLLVELPGWVFVVSHFRGWKQHTSAWASYQIRNIAGCACAGNAGNVFPATDFKGNRELALPACITARASRTCRDACRDH